MPPAASASCAANSKVFWVVLLFGDVLPIWGLRRFLFRLLFPLRLQSFDLDLTEPDRRKMWVVKL
jgi:hypothetical protein